MSELGFQVAGVLGTGLLSSLGITLRTERTGTENYLRFRSEDTPFIFVCWHGQMLPLMYVHRNEGIVILVSEHADGEYITRVLRRNGFGTVRGSSTRGATKGLKGLIRAARRGKDLALTPDGPRGPARQFKAGALAVAQATGMPIIPLAAGASAAWRFASWDGFMVPRPFSRVRVAYGDPVRVPRDADRGTLDRMAVELGHELDRLTARVDLGGSETDPAGAAGASRTPPGALP